MRRAIFVESHREFRAIARFEFRECGERNHIPRRVPDVELTDVFSLRPVGPLGFDVDLPLPSEPVEVVDEEPAHESLDGAIHIVDRHPLFDHLVAIHRDEFLRHAREKRRSQAAYFRSLARRRHELVEVVGKKRWVCAGAVFENKGHAA